jgi:hypothetical protein
VVGYKGERISIPEMLDELMQSGHSAVDAGLQIRHAIEDAALIFINSSGRHRSAPELISDIEKLASAFAARLRGERVSQGEMSWQMYLRDVWTGRELYEQVFDLKNSAKTSGGIIRQARRGAKPKYKWDLIETEFLRLMDHHGDFDATDPEWNAQARLEDALNKYCQKHWQSEPGVTTLRERLPGWLAVWRLRKLGG